MLIIHRDIKELNKTPLLFFLPQFSRSENWKFEINSKAQHERYSSHHKRPNPTWLSDSELPRKATVKEARVQIWDVFLFSSQAPIFRSRYSQSQRSSKDKAIADRDMAYLRRFSVLTNHLNFSRIWRRKAIPSRDMRTEFLGMGPSPKKNPAHIWKQKRHPNKVSHCTIRKRP